MAQFTIFRNSDPGAPQVNGLSGSLLNVLSSCLVSGYGSQSAAGWTLAFQGTGIGIQGSGQFRAAYRQGGGNLMYFRVQDDSTGLSSSVSKEARICGFETMSHWDSGSGPFPNPIAGAQVPLGIGTTGVIVRKSVTNDSTARDWIVAADDRTVYGFIKSEVAIGVAGGWYGFGFGDINSFVRNDSYRTMIIGRVIENSSASASDGMQFSNNSFSTTLGGHYIARGYLGVGISVLVSKSASNVFSTSNQLVGTIPFPNPEDGGVYVSQFVVNDPTTAPTPNIRGKMRGYWLWLHPFASVSDQQTFQGVGDLAGRSFLVLKQTPDAGGVFVIETSNTLDTNT